MSRLLDIAQRLRSLADVGVQYASNAYELDRNQEIHSLAQELMSLSSTNSLEQLQALVPLTKSYPTPKVDVRSVVFNPEGHLLFVKERADNRWAIPGGWADPGFTPKEIAEKECFEEAGITVEAEAVWAVLDKKGWGHPIPLHATYKIFMHCRYLVGVPAAGYEVYDAAFFAQDAVPDLSTERLTLQQVEYLFQRRMHPEWPVLFN
jgi:ADP-ribose pyrophosphatase YjhB (NUDIX family)